MGLINRVVPPSELWNTVNGLAARISANGPLAVRNIKRAVRSCLELPLEKAFDEELRWAAEVLASDDAEEGPRAFAEKREPKYKGRWGPNLGVSSRHRVLAVDWGNHRA